MAIVENKFNVIDSDMSKFAISPKEMFIKGLEMANVIKDYKKIHIKPDAITEV